MKKCAGGLFWLGVILVVSFLLLMVFRNIPAMKNLLQIRKGVDVVVGVSDESSKLAPLINAKVPGYNIRKDLVYSLSGIAKKDENIKNLVSELDTTINVYYKHGLESYGIVRTGRLYPVSVPLPGGKIGKIAIVLDVDIEFEEGAV